MSPWRVVFSKQAQKDARRLSSAGLRSKAERLLSILAADPFRKPPPFEKLLGDLRPIWPVIEIERVVKVLRIWTRYE